MIKIIKAAFYVTTSDLEPVREWLLGLSKEEKKKIGEAIKLVEFGWPLGMPVVRKIEADLWEVRIKLPQGNIARVFFTVFNQTMVLVHGFIKKSAKTPSDDLTLARKRKAEVLKG
jgi:phage-related protein